MEESSDPVAVRLLLVRGTGSKRGCGEGLTGAPRAPDYSRQPFETRRPVVRRIARVLHVLPRHWMGARRSGVSVDVGRAVAAVVSAAVVASAVHDWKILSTTSNPNGDLVNSEPSFTAANARGRYARHRMGAPEGRLSRFDRRGSE
jgi:hypothetical protein